MLNRKACQHFSLKTAVGGRPLYLAFSEREGTLGEREAEMGRPRNAGGHSLLFSVFFYVFCFSILLCFCIFLYFIL